MDNKKRIAVIGLKGLPAIGGAAAVGENIINQLKDKYEFIVYSISSHTHLHSGVYKGYKQIVFNQLFPGWLNTIYYYLISTIHCLFQNYDGVHIHHSMSGIFILLLKLKYPIIYTSHNTETINHYRYVHFFFSFSEKLSLYLATAVTAFAKSTYEKYLKIRPEDVYYIPNGVSQIDLATVMKNENIKQYILFGAGRILPSKGCHILLKAARSINFESQIKIVGDLNYSRDYKKKILGLSKGLNVEFLGFFKDKNKLFGYILNARMFIFPSTIEAMSMMLLEVAALKTPIICSDIKENKDIFNSDEVLFFKSGDHDDLANKIIFAKNNLKIMEKKANLAYKKVISKHLWSDISERYSSLYKKYL